MTESTEIEIIPEFDGLTDNISMLDTLNGVVAEIRSTDVPISIINKSQKLLSDDSDKLQNLEIEVLEASATAVLSKEGSEDVSIVCDSTVSNPPPSSNVLEKLHYMQHKVYGDGNCLYHAIAHQAGCIKQNCYGDTFKNFSFTMCAGISRCSFRGWNYKGSVGDKKDAHFAVRMGRGFRNPLACYSNMQRNSCYNWIT